MKSLYQIFILLLVSSKIFAQDEILINIPKEVKAGNEFIVVINIPKDFMHGASRLQLKLPNGFQAQGQKQANADFKFESQKATFFWLNFPERQEVEISLNVTSAPTLEGYFVIKGEANWLQNDEPFRTEIYPQIITVLPGDKSESELTASLEKTKFKYEVLETQGVTCLRQVPYEKDGAIWVNLLVNKGDLNKYGKIQEQIPDGFRVENVKSQNAIFIYNERQHLVKYMWMNMPAKTRFIVSYKLIPTHQTIEQSNPFYIVGAFFYAENNQTVSVDVQERGIELTESTN